MQTAMRVAKESVYHYHAAIIFQTDTYKNSIIHILQVEEEATIKVK